MYGFLYFRIYKFYLAVYWMIMYQSIMFMCFFLGQCANKNFWVQKSPFTRSNSIQIQSVCQVRSFLLHFVSCCQEVIPPLDSLSDGWSLGCLFRLIGPQPQR